MKTGHLRADRPLLRIDISAEPYVLVWRVPDPGTHGRSPTIGFVADLFFITEPLKRVLAEPSLRPPTLGNDAATVVGVRVLNHDGGQIYASSSDWSPYDSETTLDRELGNLRLGVALNPRAAETLIIGGLPRSRLPLLAGLMALTSGLVFIAIVQDDASRPQHILTVRKTGYRLQVELRDTPH